MTNARTKRRGKSGRIIYNTPVSMRLPAHIIESVDNEARSEGISRVDVIRRVLIRTYCNPSAQASAS